MEFFEPVIRFFWEGMWSAGMVEPWRRLYDCELVYVSNGIFSLQLNQTCQVMKPGMIAVIPPACWHESRVDATASAVTRHCLHFDWTPERVSRKAPLMAMEDDPFDDSLVVPPPLELRAALPWVFDPGAVAPVLDLVELLFARLRKGDSTADLLLWPVLRHLSANIRQEPQKAGMGKPIRHALELKDFLDLHYGEELSYEELSRLTGLSKCHLCTIFRKVMGRAPMEYLLEIRLTRAFRLLSTEQITIAEAAYAVGFHSPNYFTRAFRKRFGHAPSAMSRPKGEEKGLIPVTLASGFRQKGK